jgi:hypothetical protein
LATFFYIFPELSSQSLYKHEKIFSFTYKANKLTFVCNGACRFHKHACD